MSEPDLPSVPPEPGTEGPVTDAQLNVDEATIDVGGYVPPAPLKKTRRRWVGVTITSTIVTVCVAIIVGFLVHMPYYAFSPGDTRSVAPLVHAPASITTYPAKGTISYTTVLQSSDRVNLFQWLQAKVDHDIDLIPEKNILGDRSKSQADQEDKLAMTQSQQTASAVALERLGYPGLGVEIIDIASSVPAAKALKVGDVITELQGKPIHYVSDIRPILSALKPGDAITVGFSRDGTTQTADTTLADAGDGRAIIGISPQGKFAQQISIQIGEVGGPSAGLAFTLEILDLLTPGELTGAKKVAATGTIEWEGTVGPIGGIKQKTISVRDSGAVMFLVPAEEAEEARKYAGSKLQIVPVKTLDDALHALAGLGGNAEALPRYAA